MMRGSLQKKKLKKKKKKNFFFYFKKGGCPLIRACSLIRSNTVLQLIDIAYYSHIYIFFFFQSSVLMVLTHYPYDDKLYNLLGLL